MSLKNLIKLLLFATCLIVFSETFARAGGGHGGGGHSGGHGGHSSKYDEDGYRKKPGFDYGSIIIVLSLVTLLVGGTIPALLKLKSSMSQKVLTHAAHKDTFWEMFELKRNARSTFYKMQEAWQNRNIELVKTLIIPRLYALYKTMLEEMIERGEKNIISRIDITTTEIIGCEDHEDDSKDRYIAYIKGTMLDYVIHEPTADILINPKKKIADFCDTYYFVRLNNTWVLEKIDNTVTLLDIVKAKNHIEK